MNYRQEHFQQKDQDARGKNEGGSYIKIEILLCRLCGAFPINDLTYTDQQLVLVMANHHSTVTQVIFVISSRPGVTKSAALWSLQQKVQQENTLGLVHVNQDR